MTDVAQYFTADLSPSATGDLQIASSVLESQQRILRRLLTNPGDYIWQPNYGAGLPSFIGQPLDLDALTTLIKTQMFMEDSVSQNPPPQINVTEIPNGIDAQIQYVEVESTQPTVLSFTVTP
jgi:phage baseplate assembly protein W